ARRAAIRAGAAGGPATGSGRPANGPGRHAAGHRQGGAPGRPAGRSASFAAGYCSGRGTTGNNRSHVGHYRTEIETLEPEAGMAESGGLQPLEMRLLGIEQHDVLDGAALLRDFQVAVTVGPFEGVMHLLQVLLGKRLGEAEFLRQDQYA